MKKTTKVWLIAASSLVLIGGILFVIMMSTLGWDFTKLSTTKYETNTYDLNDAFDSISFKTDTADIVFALSDDGKCKVECYEDESQKHSVAVENNMLVVGTEPRPWYGYIGTAFDSSKITVYLPKTDYTSLLLDEHTGDIEIPKDFRFDNVGISVSTGSVHFCASVSEKLKIITSTGAIRIENISVGTLDLKVTTGKITVSGVTCREDVTVGVSTGITQLTDITCKNVISNGSTGYICLNHVIASEKFSIERSTGKVKFEGSDAAEIFVKTNTGNVSGNLLSEKIFFAKSHTGRVNVPESVSGGRCEITTDTGNIEMTIG